MPNFRLTFSAVCAILPLSAQLLLWGFADADYPREGTVTAEVVFQLFTQAGCRLSPRGDGYDGKYQAPRSRYLMQLIPARGRLHARGQVQCTILHDAAYPREGTVTLEGCCTHTHQADAAYPREGTVTSSAHSFHSSAILMQLSPARGRLSCTRGSSTRKRCDAAYPREGTVT